MYGKEDNIILFIKWLYSIFLSFFKKNMKKLRIVCHISFLYIETKKKKIVKWPSTY